MKQEKKIIFRFFLLFWESEKSGIPLLQIFEIFSNKTNRLRFLKTLEWGVSYIFKLHDTFFYLYILKK